MVTKMKTKTNDNNDTMFIIRCNSSAVTIIGLAVILVAIMTTLWFNGGSNDVGIMQDEWQQKPRQHQQGSRRRRRRRRRQLIDDNATATPINADPSTAPLVAATPSDTNEDDEGNDNNDGGLSSSLILCPVDYKLISGTQCDNTGDGDGDGEDSNGNTTCDYNHIYTGCTFEELQCTPIVQCKCETNNDINNDYGIGKITNNTKSKSKLMVWMCEVNFANIGSCNNIPLDLPVGELCDPLIALPTRIPTNEPSNSPSISSSSSIPTNSPTMSQTDNPTPFRTITSSPKKQQQQQQQTNAASSRAPTTPIPATTTIQQPPPPPPPPPPKTIPPTMSPTFQPTLNPTMKPTNFPPPPFQRSRSTNRLGPRIPFASTSTSSTSTPLFNNAGNNNNNNNNNNDSPPPPATTPDVIVPQEPPPRPRPRLPQTIQSINASLRRRPSVNTGGTISSSSSSTIANNNIFSPFFSF